MKQRPFVFLICSGAFALAGCGKTSRVAVSDACALLSHADIEAVQGSPIVDHKSSSQPDPNFQISQCYYTAKESNRSVSLSVTTANSGGTDGRSVKDLWEATFARNEQGEKAERDEPREKRAGARESEEEKTPPRRIDGVGTEAYWLGSPIGGALQVLHKGASLRLSLGGPDSTDAKIEKSKTLALKALSHL